jgi:hypothetical protein
MVCSHEGFVTERLLLHITLRPEGLPTLVGRSSIPDESEMLQTRPHATLSR